MNVSPIGLFCLPFTATVTLVLYSDPKEFLATHLKTKTPLFSKVLVHIPEALVLKWQFHSQTAGMMLLLD